MQVYLTISIPILISVLSAFVSYILQERKLKQEIDFQKEKFEKEMSNKLEDVKTEYMAEKAIRNFLSNPKYKMRSFSLLKARIGGFEDNELRRLLVRSGAIKFMGENKTGREIEWWGLLERNPEVDEINEELNS
jgi:hypothetical protein